MGERMKYLIEKVGRIKKLVQVLRDYAEDLSYGDLVTLKKIEDEAREIEEWTRKKELEGDKG